LEFTLPREAYVAMGGHESNIKTLDQMVSDGGEFPTAARLEGWPK
jgi:hypothetical protein